MRQARSVSTHAPTRGATTATTTARTRSVSFQPTRPRGARHGCYGRRLGLVGVSTHAPTRGATDPDDPSNDKPQVSTHAPTRGATACPPCRETMMSVFQPTRPRGARRLAHASSDAPILCFNPRAHAGRDASSHRSTHPVRHRFNPRAHAGRDSRRCLPCDPSTCFNPRAHAGRDACRPLTSTSRSWFQPTRPRGARLWRREGVDGRHGFNPRAHAGRDATPGRAGGSEGVSTHAPTRGATSTKAKRKETC